MAGYLLAEDAQKQFGDRLTQFGQQLFPVGQVQPAVQQPEPDEDLIQRLTQFGHQLLPTSQPPVEVNEDLVSRLTNQGLQLLEQAKPYAPPQLQPIVRAPEVAATLGQGAQAVQQAFTQPAQPTPPTGQEQPVVGGDLRSYARQMAQRVGIDPDLFVRQIDQESGFNPAARSPAGAQGIAQFMPATAAGMGVDTSDPYSSLQGAARLMKSNLERYGGDYAQALAAYNAGPGNVEKYGGVPPFEETQRYVRNILGGAQQRIGEVGQSVGGPVGGVLGAVSQFGDKQLTSAEAYAACGPAAAVRFAQLNGRNPTLREATDMAAKVGWTPEQGMAGLSSESALFTQMGIAHRVVGADWNGLAREAQSGNPVTISTPGHYFTADAFDPKTGKFHVGSSGTDLRGGGEWMSAEEMEGRMGKLQGGLVADNPQVPGASPFSSPPTGGAQPPSRDQGPLQAVGQAIGAVGEGLSNLRQGGLTMIDQAVRSTSQVAEGARDVLSGAAAERARQEPYSPEFQQLAHQVATAPVSAGDLGTALAEGGQPFRGQTYAGDVQVGQQLADAVITKAKDAGWQPTAEQESSAQRALGLLTPFNVSAVLALGGPRLVQSLSSLALQSAGVYGGEEVARHAGVPEEQVPLAGLAGSFAAPFAGGVLEGAAANPTVRQALRARLPAEAEVGFALGRPTGGFRAPGGEPEVPSTRMFHGTGAAFDRPERFDPEGLFGPGYYLTNEPRVAGGLVATGGEQVGPSWLASSVKRVPGEVIEPGYAQGRAASGMADQNRAFLQGNIDEARRIIREDRPTPEFHAELERTIADLEDQIAQGVPGAGANVRAVDVPQNLNLLDADRYLHAEDVDAIRNALPSNRVETFDRQVARAFEGRPMGQQVFDALTATFGRGTEASTAANRILSDAGFDGITYAGGKRIPMTDAAGRTIQHQATVVFPESLDKIRNAISGRQGGQIDPRYAVRLLGGVAGGYAGYQTTPPEAGPLERGLRTGSLAVAGAAAPSLVTRPRNPLIDQAILKSLREGGLNPNVLPSQGRGPIGTGVDVTKQFVLSNPVAHIGNLIGNTLELLRSPAGLVWGGRPGDAAAGLAAAGQAIPEATRAAWATLRGSQAATLGQGASTTRPWEPVFRMLGAADQFTRTMAEYQGMAERAAQLLRDGGLSASDPAAAQFLAGHAQDLYRAGAQSGGRSVFQLARDAASGIPALDNMFHTYSTWKDGMLNSPRLRDQALGALADFQIPFAGVPVRMLQVGLGRVPGITQATGTARAMRALAAGDMPAFQRAAGETAFESMIQAQIANGIREGNITGPDDPEHPSSIRLHGDWYDLRDFGGWTLPMQIMAGFADAAEKAGMQPFDTWHGKLAAQAQAGFNSSMKPFMRAVPGQQLVHMLSSLGTGEGATGALRQQLQDSISRMTAPGAGKFIEDLMDPVARDVQKKGVASLWEYPQSRIPGLAELLPEKIDPTTGQPLEKRRAGPGILLGQDTGEISALTSEANRLKEKGYDVAAPKTYPESVSIAGADIKLSPDEQRAVTRITGKMLGTLSERLSQPGYQNASDDRKALQLQSFLNAAERARTAAVAQVLGRPELGARIKKGQQVAGRPVTAGTVAEEFNVPFLSSSGLSADEQRQAYLGAAGAGR